MHNNSTEQTPPRFQVSHQLADKMEEIASWCDPETIYRELWTLYIHAFNDDPIENHLSMKNVNEYALTVMLTTSLLISVMDQVEEWKQKPSPDQVPTS